MSPQSDKTVVEQVCINRKRCRRLIGAITYPVHGPPSSEPSQPAGKVTRSSNQQKPPEFVPASLWHRAMQLPRSIQLFAASTTRATAPPEQPAERLAVSASNRSYSYPSIGSQHRLPLHTEKPASSRCKEKKHAQAKVVVAISHKK